MRAHSILDPPLLVTVTSHRPDELVVRICGELDLLTHGTLHHGLDGLSLEGVRTVRVELAELTFCDSRGLRQVLRFVRDGDDAGRTMIIDEPSTVVQRLLSLFAPWALGHMRLAS